MADPMKEDFERKAKPNPYKIYKRRQEKQAAIEAAGLTGIALHILTNFATPLEGNIASGKSCKGYLRWLNPVNYISEFWSALHDENRREALKVIFTAATALGLVATFFGSSLDRKLTEQRLSTDRFTKAVILLPSKEKTVRIAAIYSLERIAEDSYADHPIIIELLSDYIRDKSPRGSSKASKVISSEVQAAITVIGRRKSEQDQGKQLNLSKCNLTDADLHNANLHGANLEGTNLHGANLEGTNLHGANLEGAKLHGARFKGANISEETLIDDKWRQIHQIVNSEVEGKDFSNADLSNANLIRANLKGAILNSANLRSTDLNDANLSNAKLKSAYLNEAIFDGADLSDADLSDANLSNANLLGYSFSGSLTDLRNANLTGADLTGADLRNAKNLTSEQVKSAKNWRSATYDDDMRKKLGLPPESSKDKDKATPNPSQSSP